MLIDAHHHLWKPSRGDYGWLDPHADPALGAIAREFLADEFVALARANGVCGSVLVQAAPSIAETGWLLEQAQASEGIVLGVVGWVDMAAKDAPSQLHRLSAQPLLRGIRPMLQDIPDPAWVLQPSLAPAFRALIEQDLAFDLLVKPPQLDGAIRLLARYPELRVVVDHGAKPAIASAGWQPWADLIRSIARDTSASCKLSGLVTEAARPWRTDDLRRYADHLIESFGPARVMWGSDWPVALLASDYPRWLQVARDLTSTLSSNERAAVMGLNAIRFYGLSTMSLNRGEETQPPAD